MNKTINQIFEYIWMFILLGFLWPKGEVKNREEDLARLFKPKNQIEINEINKKAYNKFSNGERSEQDSFLKFYDELCPIYSVYMRKTIRCSQCEEEFEGGYEYRMHWEEAHFYPYLKHDSFDSGSAMRKDGYYGK